MSNFFSPFSGKVTILLIISLRNASLNCSESYAPINFLIKILAVSRVYFVFPNVKKIKNIPVVTRINHTGVYVKWEKRPKAFSEFRSSCPEVLCKKGVLKNFSKLPGKHLCQSLFFK